jgi:hypothetical protein
MAQRRKILIPPVTSWRDVRGARELTCVTCKLAFTFDLREQKFFASRGWPPPSRCFQCRERRRDVARGVR